MKARAMVLIRLLMAAMLAAALTSCASQMNKGGLVGNSYESQMRQINDTTLRITTRKKVSGDLDEVNKPGTTMYEALVRVKNGASARAAVEAKNLGYDVCQVLGFRDLTEVIEKRNSSADLGGGLSESAFTFAQGHYHNDVELAIELTVKLIPGKMPENPPPDYMDVNAVLMQFGLTDLFSGRE